MKQMKCCFPKDVINRSMDSNFNKAEESWPQEAGALPAHSIREKSYKQLHS